MEKKTIFIWALLSILLITQFSYGFASSNWVRPIQRYINTLNGGSNISLENVAFKNESNTFILNQTFEKSIKVSRIGVGTAKPDKNKIINIGETINGETGTTYRIFNNEINYMSGLSPSFANNYNVLNVFGGNFTTLQGTFIGVNYYSGLNTTIAYGLTSNVFNFGTGIIADVYGRTGIVLGLGQNIRRGYGGYFLASGTNTSIGVLGEAEASDNATGGKFVAIDNGQTNIGIHAIAKNGIQGNIAGLFEGSYVHIGTGGNPTETGDGFLFVLKNVTADWLNAKVNYSNIQNHPLTDYTNVAFINDSNLFSKNQTFQKEVKGSRVWLASGFNVNALDREEYLYDGGGTQTSNVLGHVTTRDGSITDFSGSFYAESGGVGDSVKFYVYVNGAGVWNTTDISITAGNNYKFNINQARGTDTFSAGDIINVYVTFDGRGIISKINTQVWGYVDE